MTIADRVRRSRFAFPIGFLAAAALLLINEISYRQSRAALEDLSALTAQNLGTQHLLRLVLDAETAQRGYLLTGSDEYLGPYRQAVQELPAQFTGLRAQAVHAPGLAPYLPQLDDAVRRKMSEMAETIALYQGGQQDAARNLVLTGLGLERMDEVRDIVEKMRREQQDQAAASHRDIYGALLAGRVGMGVLVLISLLALRQYLRRIAKVHDRERELREALQAERLRLQAEAELRMAELSDLSRHLQTAREDERQRLARELHDELGALLTTAKLDTARIKTRAGLLPPEIAERLSHLNDTLNSGIALKRRIIEDLWPTALTNLGLVAALETLAKDFKLHNGVAVNCALSPVSLRPRTQLTAYRLVQEALTNIAKHARASSVDISLAVREGMVEIAVADNGVGFDPNMRKNSVHGLVGMHHRVAGEGGTLVLKSAPGAGTRVLAVWPLSA